MKGNVKMVMVKKIIAGKEGYMDLDDLLLDERIISLYGEISDGEGSCQISQVINKILYLDSLNKEPITIRINSFGGSIHDMLALYDVCKSIKSKIITYTFGKALSAAAILTAILADEGCRYAYPNTEFMFHGISRPETRRVTYREIRAIKNSMERCDETIMKLLGKHTLIHEEMYMNMMDNNTVFFPASEALEYFKMIDKIVPLIK
jgi:ATP-dependent Clp protease, protease subunit